MTANEILPGIWIGDLTAAHFFQGAHLCVKAHTPTDYIFKTPWDKSITMKSGRATADQIDAGYQWLDAQQQYGRISIVHCSSGLHRSPMIIAWYLHRKNGLSLKDAFEFIQQRRPEIEARLNWFPENIHQKLCKKDCEAKVYGL